MSPAVSELVKLLLEKSKSLNKRGMMVSLPPIPMDFEGDNEEFEDICIMHKIVDSMAEEVSEASQRWMDDSGELRVSHKPDFWVKSSINAGDVEVCLMEALRVLPTDKKICDDWDKLIKLMKDTHVQLLRKLTRGRGGEMKDLEEDFNRVPVFGIQVAAFYFVQLLGSVQIPMNRGQSSLAGFVNEL
ncbi:3773_t:CDS:2 [Entrophospora sp. SA101]|nr:13346_t:CDS:2 [Entrophospora sp. SA101]CAJ0824493.1 18193_t:CDS:2 [Entrophospora sp. SA101]CAJ0824696.1 3773_t:CDS:2 [Entrophospora sp. SA101]CAJ0826145.1 20125_t:CDS:2 [Entrophospora sp. SA101]CAJ0844175.1 6283_t:CDS:2 [Entrophospora sp. SA101]